MMTEPREAIEAAKLDFHTAVLKNYDQHGAIRFSIMELVALFDETCRRHFTTTAPAEQSSLEAALSSRQWPMMSRGMEIGSITLAPCAVHEIIRLCKKHFAADPQPAHLHATADKDSNR